MELVPTGRHCSAPDAADLGTADAARWAAEVEGAVDRLDQADREPLRLVYLRRLTLAQAASELGLTEGMVSARVSAALRRLATALLHADPAH